MSESPSHPLPAPNTPMSPPVRSAYNRLIACIRESRRADERAAAKAARVVEARAEFDRIRAGQDQAA